MSKPNENILEERKRLQLELDFCNRRMDETMGFPDRFEYYSKRKKAALDALVAFNLKTIRMVPVTHVRHG